jgi:hypothetical protein
MKDSTIVVLVVAGVVALFWAASTGLIKTGIQVPQPAQNYSGYLAASTAPAVTGALNSIIGGLSNSISGWLSPAAPPTTVSGTPGQIATLQASAASSSPQTTDTPVGNQLISPTFAASPSGPNFTGLVASVQPPQNSGPVVDPSLSYASTSQAAYDYTGLAASNPYDAGYSLDFNG